MNRLIIYLIRKRLKLKKYEYFRFKNQKSKEDYYFFDSSELMKGAYIDGGYGYFVKRSNCSLNFLLSEECEIVRVK